MDYYLKENLLSTKTVLSPSRRYLLTIESYKTGNSTWNYTKGVVTRVSDNKFIIEIKRNYSTFNHKFFMKDDNEWLWTGKTYMSQCFLNLDTEEFYDNSDKEGKFCWSNIYLSPDGKTLAVHGCYWAGPYEYQFHDFSNPSNGWPILNCDTSTYSDEDKFTQWTQDNIFYFSEAPEKIYDQGKWESILKIHDRDGEFTKDHIFRSVPEVSIFLCRMNNKIILLSKLKSKERRNKDKSSKDLWRKEEETKENFMKNNELCKYILNHFENKNYWSGFGHNLSLVIDLTNQKIKRIFLPVNKDTIIVDDKTLPSDVPTFVSYL
jgi:hypothetical protein